MDIFDPENYDEGATIKIVMSAKDLPDQSIVSKKTGDYLFTFRKNITIYAPQVKKGEERMEPMVIKGYFLVSASGNINQITEDTELMWRVTLGDLYERLRDAAEYETPQ